MLLRTLKRWLQAITCAAALILAASCSESNDGADENPLQKIKIAVISDTHLMAPSLLVQDGKAFQTYLAGDRKMLVESEAIMKEVVSQLLAEKPNIVLVTGDLTKDGELESHQLMATYLKKLTDAGIKVVVTPGNHDINNPHAMRFDGDAATKVASISPSEFKNLYNPFGYGNTVAQDNASLSYVTEPVPDFRIIAIDACEYYKNDASTCVTAGTIKPETLAWVKAQVGEARAKNKEVIAIMHHGLLPHYASQTTFFPEYVVEGWENASGQLAAAGLRAVFTGHYHAQDIALRNGLPEGFIFDIETGSTVTYPSPYRVMVYQNGVLDITTKQVEQISASSLQGKPFPDFAKNFLEKGLEGQASYMLTHAPYNLPASTAAAIAPSIRNAFVAHYSGDENLSATEKANVDQIIAGAGSFGTTFKALLYGLWSDGAPADRNVSINLKTGEYTR